MRLMHRRPAAVLALPKLHCVMPCEVLNPAAYPRVALALMCLREAKTKGGWLQQSRHHAQEACTQVADVQGAAAVHMLASAILLPLAACM